jgi:hypothetical protein
MADRIYYSIDEVNALIPRLDAHFRVILQLHARVHLIQQELRKQGLSPEQAMSAPSAETEAEAEATAAEPAELQRARAAISGLTEALRDELAAVAELGGEVKGLDPALVDFWAHHQGRDVLLCWRFGERQVDFWHTPESGFAGRQPIVPGDEPGKPGET